MVLRLVVAALVVLGLASPAPAQVVTLKVATIVGNDNPFTTSAYKFKEIAEAKSGGKIKVEVYPAGQLTKNEIVAIEGGRVRLRTRTGEEVYLSGAPEGFRVGQKVWVQGPTSIAVQSFGTIRP